MAVKARHWRKRWAPPVDFIRVEGTSEKCTDYSMSTRNRHGLPTRQHQIRPCVILLPGALAPLRAMVTTASILLSFPIVLSRNSRTFTWSSGCLIYKVKFISCSNCYSLRGPVWSVRWI